MATRVPSTSGDCYYVYALLRGDTGAPFYVGKGFGFRWEQHEMPSSTRRRGHKTAIIQSLRARGFCVIKVKIHEGLTEAIAYEYEIALIKAIGRHPNGPLTNMTEGGEGVRGVTQTPEHVEKRMAKVRGRKNSPEHIAKTAAAHRGKKRSAETRARFSASRLGKKQSAQHIANGAASRRGKKRSPETIAKLSAKRKGLKFSPEWKANISAGQRKRAPASAETRAKMSAKTTARNLGHKHSPETKAKIAAANTGKKQSAEQIAKRRETVRVTKLRKQSAG
jgi:hypothetical protein